MYILLEKLKITDSNDTQELKEIIKTIKEIAAQNKYISYSDKATQEAMKLLNSLTPNRIIADGKSILSKPMLEAYKKEGDRYLLKPTKYACDTAKQLANRFDLFHDNNTCSDSQYQDLLEELNEV